jgi:hypothetical protein
MVGVTVGLIAADLLAGAEHSVIKRSLVVDAQSGFVDLIVKDLAGIPQSNLDALAAAPRVRVIPRPPASRTD